VNSEATPLATDKEPNRNIIGTFIQNRFSKLQLPRTI